MGILEIRNYTKAYGEGRLACDNISLSVEAGDIYGFIGHNGAGKSTTIKAVVGVLDFEQGEILIDGHSVKDEPMQCKQRADPIDCILFVPEGLALCTFSTVFGMVCGIRYMRLDWENEIEVIKQSTAVTVYILPNLFGTMGIIVGSVILGTVIGTKAVSVIITVVAAMLAGICYLRVKTLVKKQTV